MYPKISELKEGEWIEYCPEHTDAYVIQFIHEYGQVQAYIYQVNWPDSGVNVYLDLPTLDRYQQEILDNKGREIGRFIKE